MQSAMLAPRSQSPNAHRTSFQYPPRGEQYLHTPQQSSYSKPNAETSTEYTSYSEGEQPSLTLPSHLDAIPYRNNSMFAPFYPPRARQTLGGSSVPFETNHVNLHQFTPMANADVFSTNQALPHLVQHQQSNGRAFDFSSDPQMKPNGKGIFQHVDPFASPSNGGQGPGLLQAHQHSKPGNVQPQQQHMHAFPGQSFGSIIHNQPQAHSATPFGPHLSSGIVNGPALTQPNGLGPASVTTQQEEISTIFVVGFPEDMQEREFQNMFTFSSGFEAATLKIPNKDSTAYGANVPSGTSSNTTANRGVFQMNYAFSGVPDAFTGVNQSSGVDASGRDTVSSWPSSDSADVSSNANSGPNVPPSSNAGPPRKQIIGFAKFRTRAEALAARDLLQGRRVDIEKGAVLKAEMAKKNLHTKRGVGPLGAPLSVNVGNSGSGSALNTIAGPSSGGNLGSLTEGMGGLLSPAAGSSVQEALSARDRELGTLGAMGLGNLTRRDPRSDTQEEEREMRRRRDFNSLNSITNSMSTMNILGMRGARERMEDDEREKRRREKESERGSRLRLGNQMAYDGLHHSVIIPQRNPSYPSSTILSPTDSMSGINFSGSQPFSPQNNSGHLPSMDTWPISPKGQPAPCRLGSLPLGGSLRNIAGLSIGLPPNAQQTLSLESSPIDAIAESDPLSSRGSDKAHPLDSERTTISSSSIFPSHASASSLGSRSRPYSPSNDGPMASINSTLSEQQASHERGQGGALSSIMNSSISPDSVNNSSVSDESKVAGTVELGNPDGTMSPQIPSPNSGAASGNGAKTNASDQNPPINTLYVGNLPTSPMPGTHPNFLEESLRSLFARCLGYRKLCFRQKSNGPMCFVEFEDVSYATKALTELYGNTLNGLVKGGIRLSYSKNPLGVRTPTGMTNGGGNQSLQSFGSSSLNHDTVPLRQPVAGILSVDTNPGRARRDTNGVASPFFASSPPPRFFSPSPTSLSFSSHSTAPALSRSGSQGYSMTFSPFGNVTPPEFPSIQPSFSEIDSSKSSHNLPLQSLEETRAT